MFKDILMLKPLVFLEVVLLILFDDVYFWVTSKDVWSLQIVMDPPNALFELGIDWRLLRWLE